MTEEDRASGRATHEQSQQAVSAVPVGIPDAARLIAMMSAYASMSHAKFHAAYPEFADAHKRAMEKYIANYVEGALFAFVEWADAIYLAQGMEARQGGDEGSVHDSQVACDAPIPASTQEGEAK